MRNPFLYVNISQNLFGALISLIIVLFLAVGAHRHERLNRRFMLFALCNALVLLSDALAWIFNGGDSVYAFFIVRAGNFLVFTLTNFLAPLFADYLITFVEKTGKASRKIVHIMYGMCAAAVVMVIISQFNGMYYDFVATNLYLRRELFWVSQVWGIVFTVMGVAIIFRYRRRLRKREMFLFLSYIVLPAAALAIQIFFYGIALLHIAMTFTIVLIYVGIQAQQVQEFKQKELALTESRISVMLSQIQPHFMFNSLTAIIDLCDKNPQAQKALLTFSEYLRVNMDSLSQKQPVPFETELCHVKQYLWLEQLRFEEKLRVEYDIRAADFMLPVLSVQPIVENAVYHGLFKKGTGDTVTIRTEETENSYRITVADNGVGFDLFQPPENDGRSHVGIENVRSRLAALCGGTLAIHSKVGEGTMAVIEIPKQEKR